APSRAVTGAIQSRSRAWSSKVPCAPWSPGTGENRFEGRAGSRRRFAYCASKPWRARYRSAYPGASFWPRIALTVGHPRWTERRARPPHEAEVRHARDALELLRRERAEAAEHRGRRVVDPDVDLAELALDPLGGRGHLRGLRDVARDREHAPGAEPGQLARG